MNKQVSGLNYERNIYYGKFNCKKVCRDLKIKEYLFKYEIMANALVVSIANMLIKIYSVGILKHLAMNWITEVNHVGQEPENNEIII